MTDNSLRHNAETRSVPETPPDLTAQQYRTATYEVPCFVLLSAALTVDLLDDPHRARFTVECLVEPRWTAGAQEFATEEWVYDIPALEPEVTAVRAWDEAGNLETSLLPFEARGARLRVRFRRLVRNGSRYRFWYAYEAPVRTVVSTRMLSQMVVCTGWLIFNLPCESIRVCIQLPGRARLVKSTPSRRGDGAGAGAAAGPLSPGAPAPVGVVAVAGGVRAPQDRRAAVRVDGGADRRGDRGMAHRAGAGRLGGPRLSGSTRSRPLIHHPPVRRRVAQTDAGRVPGRYLVRRPRRRGRATLPTPALTHFRTHALLS